MTREERLDSENVEKENVPLPCTHKVVLLSITTTFLQCVVLSDALLLFREEHLDSESVEKENVPLSWRDKQTLFSMTNGFVHLPRIPHSPSLTGLDLAIKLNRRQ
jgi:hypothetical protein